MRRRIPISAALLALLAMAPGAWGQSAGHESADQAEYVVAGGEAWSVASRLGFEFYPVIPDDRFILAGPRDGAWTALKSCGAAGEACDTEAQVIDGEIVILECDGDCDRVHEFRLFDGRPLAPGWTLRGVELAGDGWSWVRRPRGDTRDASFSIRVASRRGAAATVTIRSLRLAGPAGSDWRAAFAAP